MAENKPKKVSFGIKNGHYAIVTEEYTESTGSWSSNYGTVKSWPGSVSVSLTAEGEETEFYADDGLYYSGGSNAGYKGTLEVATVPEDIYTDVYGQLRDENGLLIEGSDDTTRTKYIALMFEIDGDGLADRYCFYKVKLNRLPVTSKTVEKGINVNTFSIDITCVPRPDDKKIKCIADAGTTATTAGATQYENFYESVPVPTFAA